MCYVRAVLFRKTVPLPDGGAGQALVGVRRGGKSAGLGRSRGIEKREVREPAEGGVEDGEEGVNPDVRRRRNRPRARGFEGGAGGQISCLPGAEGEVA